MEFPEWIGTEGETPRPFMVLDVNARPEDDIGNAACYIDPFVAEMDANYLGGLHGALVVYTPDGKPWDPADGRMIQGR